VILTLAAGPAGAGGQPLALHPDNPHYFLFRGRPTVLVTSGEHYGAVLNRDFDYIPYLDELKARRFNLTRTFSGCYREVPGSFGITDNTLAPAPGRYLCPWARSATPGAADGGHKFDLGKWDPAYLGRLRDFVAQALARAGKAYAVYVRGGTRAELLLDMPPGPYRAEWVNTQTGRVDKAEDFDHAGGDRKLASPDYRDDIALRVRRRPARP
jgi:hypothetical protein